jgi:hypothetical protein
MAVARCNFTVKSSLAIKSNWHELGINLIECLELSIRVRDLLTYLLGAKSLSFQTERSYL